MKLIHGGGSRRRGGGQVSLGLKSIRAMVCFSSGGGQAVLFRCSLFRSDLGSLQSVGARDLINPLGVLLLSPLMCRIIRAPGPLGFCFSEAKIRAGIKRVITGRPPSDIAHMATREIHQLFNF